VGIGAVSDAITAAGEVSTSMEGRSAGGAGVLA
jgi:hypothetical protein